MLKKKDEDRVFMGFDNRQIFHFCQSSFTGAVGVAVGVGVAAEKMEK